MPFKREREGKGMAFFSTFNMIVCLALLSFGAGYMIGKRSRD